MDGFLKCVDELNKSLYGLLLLSLFLQCLTFDLMRFSVIILTLLCFCTASFSQVAASNTCKRTPVFATVVGFSREVILTTSYPGKKGLVMADPGNMARFYQDSSWVAEGYMGSFTTDEEGNIYLLPAPHVNLNDNPIDKNNYIYRVDSKTGKLSVFAKLPNMADKNSPNAFGVLGIAYHCSHQSLYISTVNGSQRKKELGRIYQVDIKTGKMLDSLTAFDAYGLLAVTIDEKEFLLVGSARNSNLYQIQLDKKGGFGSPPIAVLTVAGLGPRGDDRIKKIEFNSRTFHIQLRGHEFNFNLSAPSEDQQTLYEFSWNGKSWEKSRTSN